MIFLLEGRCERKRPQTRKVLCQPIGAGSERYGKPTSTDALAGSRGSKCIGVWVLRTLSGALSGGRKPDYFGHAGGARGSGASRKAGHYFLLGRRRLSAIRGLDISSAACAPLAAHTLIIAKAETETALKGRYNSESVINVCFAVMIKSNYIFE